jgi:hypothetical protein
MGGISGKWTGTGKVISLGESDSIFHRSGTPKLLGFMGGDMPSNPRPFSDEGDDESRPGWKPGIGEEEDGLLP